MLMGLLFVWAALSKLGDPMKFYTSLLQYDMPLPDLLLRVAAMILPWLELLCGLALLAGVWLASTLLVTLLLVIAFVASTGQAWVRGLDISRGCFRLDLLGLAPDSPAIKFIESVTFAFFRNLVFLVVSVWLYRSAIKTKPIEPPAMIRAIATRDDMEDNG